MSASREKLIIIGNGMTAIRFLEKLHALEPDRYQITVIGEEPHPGYNRILLSPLLSGEKKLHDVITHPDSWYQEKNINLLTCIRIDSIDRDAKLLHDSDGNTYEYDKLIIATGSRPFIPKLPGTHLSGVYSYRTINDVKAMLEECESAKKAVVIGGGLLGLEVAYGLNACGVDVTVCHRGPVLMERQLDKMASMHLQDLLSSKGINIRTSANTRQLKGMERVEAVELDDGEELTADIVVFAVGIRPEINLAEAADLYCEKGIVVNDQMQTSDNDVFALGECAEHRGISYGLVAPLYAQAEVCAQYLCGDKKTSYTGSVTATGLKVTGVHLFSAGQFNQGTDCKTVSLNDQQNRVYRKLVFKNKRLIGALLFGDIHGSNWYQELIETGEEINQSGDAVMFGNKPESMAITDSNAKIQVEPSLV